MENHWPEILLWGFAWKNCCQKYNFGDVHANTLARNTTLGICMDRFARAGRLVLPEPAGLLCQSRPASFARAGRLVVPEPAG